jgi:aromatic-L-amino-acid decarboxylase
MLGFPESSMGLLVSGGSMATLTALAVARHVKSGVDVRAKGLRDAPTPFAFYMTAEGHTCARKALELLGFGSESIRTIPTDDDYRMRVDALASAISDDRARGMRPIAVVATAGTTNTGAIDDIEAISALCRQHDIWLHVDAAYGGPAILTGEYGPQLSRAFSGADSVALDPHKWMFVPVEAGFVIVRDAQAMRAAFSLVPPYIRSAGSPTGVYGLPWFSEYGFQQTRGFRALKVWMTIKHEGLEGLKATIEENIALARYLADRIHATPQLELIASGLSVVCFRYVGADTRAGLNDVGADPRVRPDDETIAALNRAILDRLQLGGEAFITSTELKGRFVLRACIVNYRSTRGDIDRLIDTVTTIARDL